MLLEKAIEIARNHHASCPITLKQYKVKMEGDLAVDENCYNRELSLSRSLDEVSVSLSQAEQAKNR